MKATVKIEMDQDGKKITIEADCDTVQEVQEITENCRRYAPGNGFLRNVLGI